MTLNELRKEIDNIDDKLLKLLIQRMELALDTIDKKPKIEDNNREAEILDKIMKEYPENYDYFSKIYELMFTEAKLRMKKINESRKNERYQ